MAPKLRNKIEKNKKMKRRAEYALLALASMKFANTIFETLNPSRARVFI